MHPGALNDFHNLARVYQKLGRREDARLIFKEVALWSKDILGERHLVTISASYNLAINYSKSGRPDQSQKILEEVVSLRKEILGDRHLATIDALHDLALPAAN